MKSNKLTPALIRKFLDCPSKAITSFLDAESVSINAQDRKGRTLLSHSIERATDVVTRSRKLLSLGADPNLADHGGVTPLMEAVDTQSSRNCVSLLLAAGANVHAKSAEGQTALGVCINAGGGGEVMGSFIKLMTAGARDPGVSFVNNPSSRHFTNTVNHVNKTGAKLETQLETTETFLSVMRSTVKERQAKAAASAGNYQDKQPNPSRPSV